MMFGECRASDGKASTKKKRWWWKSRAKENDTQTKRKQSKAKAKAMAASKMLISPWYFVNTLAQKTKKSCREKSGKNCRHTAKRFSSKWEFVYRVKRRNSRNGRYRTNVHILSPSVAGSASNTNTHTHTHTCGRWILCARGWSNQITYPFDSMVDVSLRLTLWCVPHLPSANEFEKQQRHRYPSPRISPPASPPSPIVITHHHHRRHRHILPKNNFLL